MSIEEIRWRGPRPLAAGDVLKGRDAELDNLVNKARNFDVLEITAPSGVGKSSFIAAGLVTELRLTGAQVRPVGRDFSWSTVLTAYDREAGGTIDAERLYRLCLGWPAAAEGEPSVEELFTELRKRGKPVVVLDQFEELIRYREHLGKALLTYIGQKAVKLRVTHVIAGRSEYRDQLRPVEEASKSFFHWPLAEIAAERSVDDIIETPVRKAGVAIEKDAVTALRTWWVTARDDSAATAMGSVVGRADVGLLHLQGVLWLFREWLLADDPDAAEITVDHVHRFAERYVGGKEHGPGLYRKGLVEYIRESCATLHEPANPGEHWSPGHRAGRGAWTNGPRLMMARSAHLLAVLGYKVAQSRSGMFHTVLAEDLEPAKAREVAATAASVSSKGWLDDVVRTHGDNKKDAGRGLARGWKSDHVLAELVAAANQAWAAASGEANILRRFSQTDDEVYELVHDGMGLALQEWAAEELLAPRSLLGVITPRAGSSLELAITPATFLAKDGEVPAHWDGIVSRETDRPSGSGDASPPEENRRRVEVRGLGWDASAIESDLTDVTLDDWTLTGAAFIASTFRNVTFRRCDLRGVVFLGVTMEGVRFEGCNLQGAAVKGSPSLTDVTLTDLVPGDDEVAPEQLDLLSFEGCEAAGAGVSVRATRPALGLVFKKVTGGPWRVEGERITHLALRAAGTAGFELGPGRYEHVTLEPPDLVVTVDAGAVVVSSDTTRVGEAPA